MSELYQCDKRLKCDEAINCGGSKPHDFDDKECNKCPMDKDAKCELFKKSHYDTKQVIVLRRDLNMRKGKMCSQASHASLGIFSQNMKPIRSNDGIVYGAIINLNNEMLEWFENSFAKVCLQCDSETELLKLYSLAKLKGLPCILITDNGTTEFHNVPTNTCIAIGPAESEEIDKITGHLKLL